MIVGRILGMIFLALAFLTAGAEIVRTLEAGRWNPLTLGELWFTLDTGSLNLSQAVIQRYVHPAIWDPGIITLLRSPSWIFFGILGILLLALCRRRAHRSPRRS